MENRKTIRALEGAESLLLILPKEVSLELHIAHQDLLKFEVKGRELIIQKIERRKRSEKATKDMKEEESNLAIA